MLRNDDYLYNLLRKIGLSRLGAQTGQYFVKIALILAIAVFVSRAGGALARRFVNSLGTRSALYIESPRAEQRIRTIGGVVASLVRIAVWVLASTYVFDLLGFNLGPLLAGASIIGIALGFGAQTLVRDFLSGFFILVEDQYGVGDVVTVTDKVSGTIEEVNLRVTRLRGVDGTVWYVPNGEIRSVGNAAKDWARAIVDIVLPYAADSAAALQRHRRGGPGLRRRSRVVRCRARAPGGLGRRDRRGRRRHRARRRKDDADAEPCGRARAARTHRRTAASRRHHRARDYAVASSSRVPWAR